MTPALRVALQALKLRPHVRRALIAQVAVLLQRTQNHRLESGRNLRIQLRWRHRLLVQNCPQISPELSPGKGSLPVAIS